MITIAKRLSMGSAAYALACIPAILIADYFGWSASFYHLSQLLAVVLCWVASLVYLLCHQGPEAPGYRLLALLSFGVCSAWLAFGIWLLFFRLDFSIMD